MSARARSTPDGRRVIVHERSAWRALFGIRFWEHGLDRPLGDGLSVAAYAIDESGAPLAAVSPARALCNPDGVYVFHRLPAGRGDGGAPEGGGKLAIEVRDPLERFLPVVYVTADPFAETSLFLTAAAAAPAGPSGEADPRFYLFSSPARHVSPLSAAVVRAQLWDREADHPAAYAVLEVRLGEKTWYGLADGNGSALVAFAYPPVAAPAGGPPDPAGDLGDSPGAPAVGSHGASAEGLFGQCWEVEVRVRYQRGEALPALSGFGLPELGAIASQPYAKIAPDGEAPPIDSLACPVAFGRELTLRTAGESVLWV